MNLANNSNTDAGASYAADNDEIDLQQLLYTLLDHKWLIASITGLFAALGLAYALLATPIYESNILVQVESASSGMGNNLISEASSLFEVKTDAAAEVEILRSRKIAAEAVDALGLNITAKPKYLPLVGEGVARMSDGLSEPGFLGLGGYVWGSETIHVSQFLVPRERTNSNFVLTALGEGNYELHDSFADLRFKGKVGETVALNFESPGDYTIRVDELLAKPGAQFNISARSRLQEIESIQSRLNVKEQGKLSGVIKVSMQGAKPQEIAQILNTIAHEYLHQNIQRKTEEAENSLQFLGKQLPELKKELEAAENQYNKFRNERGTVNLGEEASALLQRATAMQAKLSELKQKRLELGTRFLAEHPSMQAVDAMLQQTQIEAEGVDSQIRRLPLVEQDALRLTRDMKVSTDLYASLLQTMQQLKLVKAGKVGNVRLIDDAFLPERPVAPKRSMIFTLAALLGLFAGIAVVLLRRAMRGAIESVEQVEQITGLPVFASVPHSEEQDQITVQLKSKRPADILAYTRVNDPAVESLRSFLTAMQFATLTARNNIVLITGPTPAVGKSFISVNFAAVLAASGKRVLLIDGDLRKGYLNRYFGLPQKAGFSEMVAGTLSQADAIHAKIQPNIDFMACGAYPPNPTELLRHAHTAEFFARVASLYDYIVVDAAPVLPVSDSAILAAHAGSTIMVVREGMSTTNEIIEAQKRLGQAGVAITGLLVNDLVTHRARYRYGYAYSYGYGNGAPESKKTSLWQRLLK